MADDQIATLTAQVAKEKASARENLKKLMKISQEKKAVEEQLQAAQTKLQELQADLESAKEEALYWQDEAEASASQMQAVQQELQAARQLAEQAQQQSAPSSGTAADVARLEEQLAAALAEKEAEAQQRRLLEEAKEQLEREKQELSEEVAFLTDELEEAQQAVQQPAVNPPPGGRTDALDLSCLEVAPTSPAASSPHAPVAAPEATPANGAADLHGEDKKKKKRSTCRPGYARDAAPSSYAAAPPPPPPPRTSAPPPPPPPPPAPAPAPAPAPPPPSTFAAPAPASSSAPQVPNYDQPSANKASGLASWFGAPMERRPSSGAMGASARPSVAAGVLTPQQKELVALESKRLGNRVHALFGSGNYREALTVAEEQMLLLMNAYGTGHHEYATSMNNVATLFQALGRYTEAEPLLLEASKIQQKTLGNDHPHTVASLSNLATVYEAMEQVEKAAAMQSLVAQMKKTWDEKQRAKRR